MDQLEMAVAMQAQAARHAQTVQAAEQRRMLRERAAAQPKVPETYVMVPETPRPSLRDWFSGHVHLAWHRPTAR